jgi:(p)ppGpp synthase/HD superfamily hydrolase
MRKKVQPTTSLSYDTMATMALRPPHPKSCQNMTRSQGAAAKRISAISWGQCASFQCNSHKKKQNSPFVSNKVKNLLASETLFSPIVNISITGRYLITI